MIAIANNPDSYADKRRWFTGTGPARALAVLFLLWGPAASATKEITVPAGDVVALQQIIEQANAGTEQYRLSVSGAFEFGPDQSLPPIVGNVVIRSSDRGAAIFRRSDDGGPDQLIRVEPGGRLVLRGLLIGDFSLSSLNEEHEGPLIENRGELLLESLHFENVRGTFGIIRFNFLALH